MLMKITLNKLYYQDGCPREDVVDLRTRNVKKYSNFPETFTMCYVLSLDSELYNRRTGFNVFSNSLVDVYFTNIEYKSEKRKTDKERNH